MKVYTPVVLLMILSLSSCLDDGKEGPSQLEYEHLEEERDDLKQDLEEAYLELDDYDLKFENFEELEAKAQSADEKASELEELKKKKEEVEEEMRKLREEYEAYQKKYEAKVRTEGVGEEFATLMVGGRTLNTVVINSISETGVRVRHADGFATLDSQTAPRELKERFFLRSEEEIVERAAELAAFLNPPVEGDASDEDDKPVSAYHQKRETRAAEDKAIAGLEQKVGPAMVSITGVRLQGSGFFVQDGITTYLYTAASLFDNNPHLKIVDRSGKEWKSFGEIEVSKGNNLARLAVTEPVDNALRLRSRALEPGSLVAVLAIADDGQQLIQEESKMRTVEEDRYQISTNALAKITGGPIVTINAEVSALVTYQSFPRKSVWESEPPAVHSRARRIALRLDVDHQWHSVSLGRFVGAREVIKKFDQASQLIYAVARLKVTPDGLNLSERLHGSASIQEILVENRQSNLAKQVMTLHQTLGAGGTRLSERDINRKLRSLYETTAGGANQTLPEESFSSYHWNEVQVSRKFREKAGQELQRALTIVK